MGCSWYLFHDQVNQDRESSQNSEGCKSGFSYWAESSKVADLQAKIDVVKITDIYPSEQRNKNVISMTVRRAHFEDESKTPDWPGRNRVNAGRKVSNHNFQAPGSLRRITPRKTLRADLFSKQPAEKHWDLQDFYRIILCSISFSRVLINSWNVEQPFHYCAGKAWLPFAF